MDTMTYTEFRRRVSKGAIFTVVFRKRTGDREVRTMNCRVGVKKYLAGGPPAYDPEEHDLMWVYDVQKTPPDGYRSINLRGLMELRLGGVTYDWNFGSAMFTRRE